MVIESKRVSFSIEVGLAQMLVYLLANPNRDKPGYGIVATVCDNFYLKFTTYWVC
ncbi:hypothetical protein QUA41_20920 [Microcoleus sp. Pol11C1]|uniref:hypothetical protein n=1 Tax=unclassified Microcoleus TaxID=2642155 RepID=UPI002FD2BFD1